MRSDEKSVLTDLIRARDNIKRKFNDLKQQRADNEVLIGDTLKPIINPLEKIADFNEQNYLRKAKDEKDKKFRQENIVKDLRELYDVKTEKKEDNFLVNLNKYIGGDVDENRRIERTDKLYGPKLGIGGKIVSYGNAENVTIDWKNEKIFIDNEHFPLTRGLVQLIFNKQPIDYDDQDLRVYKQILILTSAHLRAGKGGLKKGGNKYYKIIEHLFSSGGGLYKPLIKGREEMYVYWDDPNELVSRLKLLMSSKNAGNTGLDGEIISIFEELLESGYIKRMPDHV